MNFFDHQEQARRQTRRMLFLFALAVLAIVAATDVVVLLRDRPRRARIAPAAARRAGARIVVLSLCVVDGDPARLALSHRDAQRRRRAVARELGGTETTGATDNFAYRRLRNVVEEMAIASGVPVPRIFVLENEAGINAFASGYYAGRRRDHRHARRARQADARRAAGRDRPRVQPRAQWRHAPQHPPHGRRVRHPRARDDRPQDRRAFRTLAAAATAAASSCSASRCSSSATSASCSRG